MNKLINSAMMPIVGDYSLRACTRVQFAWYLRNEPFESFIGYPETARILSDLSGVEVRLSREQTTVQPGDRLLIARLKYRVIDPKTKGQTTHTIEDFEFFTCIYGGIHD